jgi:hypothetical protein
MPLLEVNRAVANCDDQIADSFARILFLAPARYRLKFLHVK